MLWFMLPNQDWARMNMTYTQLFLFTLIWNLALYFMLVLFIFCVLLALKLYRIKKQNRQYNKSSLLSQARSSNDLGYNIQQNLISDRFLVQYPDSKAFKILNIFTSIFFYLILIFAAMFYLAFYGFGTFGNGTGHDILSVVLMIAIVLIPTILWKYKTKKKTSSFKQLKIEICITIVLIVLWMGISIVSIIMMSRVCVCDANDNYGVKVYQDFVFSTRFSRSHLSKVCQQQQVCHFYATLPQQTSDSVFFNIHTGVNVFSITIQMAQFSDLSHNFTKISDDPIILDQLQYLGERNFYTILFENLTPATLYTVNVINSNTNESLWKTNYKTLPNQQYQQIRIAVGGDVALTKNGTQLTSHLSAFKPDVIIIGGDVAYDDGMRTCFYSWDTFYWMFAQVDFQLNRTVPFIMAVGNHEVGYDALANVQVELSLQKSPFFFLFNPQHLSNSTATKIPKIDERQTVHYHKIGNSVILTLDSAYLKDFASQKNFIQEVSQKFNNTYKLAVYHNPIYPSCTDQTENSNDANVIQNGKQHWTPLFDKYQFVAALEHHTHHHKITKKIKGGQLNENGVRYVGDGSWGQPEPACQSYRITPNKIFFQYFDELDPKHMWEITIKPKNINYTSVGINGNLITTNVDDLPTY